MGPRGVEPLTSSLSGTRSNQLSYGPSIFGRAQKNLKAKSSQKMSETLVHLTHFTASSSTQLDICSFYKKIERR